MTLKESPVVAIEDGYRNDQAGPSFHGPHDGRGQFFRVRCPEAFDTTCFCNLYRVDGPKLSTVTLQLFVFLRQFDERIAAIFKNKCDKRRPNPFGTLEFLTIH